MQGLEKFTIFIFIYFFGKGCPNKRNCHMSTVNHSIYQFIKIDCTSEDPPQGNTTLKPTTMQPLVKKGSLRELQQKSLLYCKLFHAVAKTSFPY